MPNGWVQLPCYATRNAAPDVMPEWDFVGFSANSFVEGASGVLGIPIPPDADRVRRVRVAGRIVKGKVTFNLTRSRLGGDNRQLARGSSESGQPADFDLQETVSARDGRIGRNDTLSLTIYADAGPGHRTHIHLVAVQFQRSPTY